MLTAEKIEVGLFMAEEKLAVQFQKSKSKDVERRLLRVSERIDRLMENNVRVQKKGILKALNYVRRRKSEAKKINELLCTWSLGVPAGLKVLRTWWEEVDRKIAINWKTMRKSIKEKARKTAFKIDKTMRKAEAVRKAGDFDKYIEMIKRCPFMPYKKAAADLLGYGYKAGIRRGLLPDVRTAAGWSEVAAAKCFIKRHVNDLRYIAELKSWYRFNGAIWVEDTGNMAHQEMKKLAEDTVEAAVVLGTREKKLIIGILSRRHINAVLELSAARLCATPGQFDQDPKLLCVKNGVIDLLTSELKPHSRNDLMMKMAPAEYNPNARDEVWEDVIVKATREDEGLQRYLQKAAGYSVVGEASEEKVFLVHGRGGTLKSTFIGSIQATLGPYAMTASFKMFTRQKVDSGDGSGPSEHIARLNGARVVISSEVSEGKKLAEDIVKNLTGRDKLVARIPHARRSFEFMPVFALWLVANDAPHVSPVDDAIWRRIHRIPFVNKIPEEAQNPEIKKHLALRETEWVILGKKAWVPQI